MYMKRIALLLIGTLLASLMSVGPALPAAAAGAGAGRIVVNHDEWTFSNTGFANQPASTSAFALNVASWFTGGGPGKFLVYTHNFGLTQSSFVSTLQSAGHTVTISTSLPFTLATLQQYDAVFLGGYAANNQVLIDYVNAGGNVYLAGGTGSLNEAAVWNTFLHAFGMEYLSSYNGVGGNIGGLIPHPLTAGVSALYYNNGSTITKLNSADLSVTILASYSGKNLIAAYGNSCDPTPALGWKAPLSGSAAYDLPNGSLLPVRFSWGSCGSFQRDESVIVQVTNVAAPYYPVTAYVYGGGVEIDESAGEYQVNFASGDYNLAGGTVLRVDVYMSDQFVGSAMVQIVP